MPGCLKSCYDSDNTNIKPQSFTQHSTSSTGNTPDSSYVEDIKLKDKYLIKQKEKYSNINFNFNNLTPDEDLAISDIIFEYNDDNNGYKSADFIKNNYINIKFLKEHLRNGYKEYEYLALRLMCSLLEKDNRINELNAIHEYYERF